MAVESEDPEPYEPALGLAGFAFGLFALLTSPIVVGAFLGAIGLSLSVIHLTRPTRHHPLALWGVALSTLGIAASVVAGVVYFRHFQSAFRPAPDRPPFVASRWEWNGKAAPPLVVTTIDGRTVDLSSLRGRSVLVDFWATWCPPCVKEIPHLNAVAKEHADDLVAVALSEESIDDVRDFAKRHAMDYHVAAGVPDSSLPAPYGSVKSLPTVFFIDGTGVIRAARSGYLEKDALESRVWMLAAATQRAKGDEEAARRLAALALETHLDGTTEGELSAIFKDDPGYAALHDRVQGRVEALIGHYEDKYHRPLVRDRASALWVIWSLGAEKKDVEAVPYLIRYLRESAFPDARWRAADALWQIGDRRAVPDLVAALDDPVPKVAGFAASALGDLGDRTAVDPLLELFQRLPDNRDEAKARVADALGKLGDKRSIAPLSASLEVIREPAYVRWAEPALRRLEGTGGRD
jgi:thiol-disulfide isomerase/thioredoxin